MNTVSHCIFDQWSHSRDDPEYLCAGNQTERANHAEPKLGRDAAALHFVNRNARHSLVKSQLYDGGFTFIKRSDSFGGGSSAQGNNDQPSRFYRWVTETGAFVQFLSDLTRTDKLVRELARHIERFHPHKRNQRASIDHDAFSHCERSPIQHPHLRAADCLPGCRFWSRTSENQHALCRTAELPGRTSLFPTRRALPPAGTWLPPRTARRTSRG